MVKETRSSRSPRHEVRGSKVSSLVPFHFDTESNNLRRRIWFTFTACITYCVSIGYTSECKFYTFTNLGLFIKFHPKSLHFA